MGRYSSNGRLPDTLHLAFAPFAGRRHQRAALHRYSGHRGVSLRVSRGGGGRLSSHIGYRQDRQEWQRGILGQWERATPPSSNRPGFRQAFAVAVGDWGRRGDRRRGAADGMVAYAAVEPICRFRYATHGRRTNQGWWTIERRVTDLLQRGATADPEDWAGIHYRRAHRSSRNQAGEPHYCGYDSGWVRAHRAGRWRIQNYLSTLGDAPPSG